MSLLIFAALLQAAPPVVDPILDPHEARAPLDAESEAQDPPRAPVPASRLARCAELAGSDAEAAIAEGARWLLDNGGASAEQCLGLGYAAAGRWEEAAAAFDRGAQAETGDRRTALLLQAANAALAGGDAATAQARLDGLIADESLADSVRGEALVDRARAHVSLGDGPAAQADLTAAQALIPNHPAVWLYSATLARRQGALDAAGDFIDRALELDGEDAAILLEAGNIAVGLNAYRVAREAWERAAALEPDSEAGQAAARNLVRLEGLAEDPADDEEG